MNENNAIAETAKVFNNLIDKLSSATGWVVGRRNPKREGESTYIEEIKNSTYDPLTKAALISNAKRIIKEYSNQEDIVAIALKSVKPTAEPNKIDDDWLMQFMDKARLVSNDEIKLIWGAILSEECNSPGKIPKVLLHILEQMDEKSARDFTAVVKVCVWYGNENRKDWVPIIIKKDLDSYRDIGITYEKLINLKALGLIETNFDFGSDVGVQFEEGGTVHYHSHKYEVEPYTDFHAGSVLLTSAGNALCNTIVTDEVEGFFESICVPYWNKNNEKREK